MTATACRGLGASHGQHEEQAASHLQQAVIAKVHGRSYVLMYERDASRAMQCGPVHASHGCNKDYVAPDFICGASDSPKARGCPLRDVHCGQVAK